MDIGNSITCAIAVIAIIAVLPALADENANRDFSIPLMPFSDANHRE